MSENEMVKPPDFSSDTEQTDQIVRKHNRSSSSDQAKSQQSLANNMPKSSEHHSMPASPSKSKAEKPQNKRRKSSTSTKQKSRPAYSRRYSTPPSRPLSPAGFPQLLEPDMVIPELDLTKATHHLLEVDTAPQEPDLWSDPETDYFSTIEGPAARHNRGKSRRQLSQNMNATNSLNAMMASTPKGLQQISEDAEAEYQSLRVPGGFST